MPPSQFAVSGSSAANAVADGGGERLAVGDFAASFETGSNLVPEALGLLEREPDAVVEGVQLCEADGELEVELEGEGDSEIVDVIDGDDELVAVTDRLALEDNAVVAEPVADADVVREADVLALELKVEVALPLPVTLAAGVRLRLRLRLLEPDGDVDGVDDEPGLELAEGLPDVDLDGDCVMEVDVDTEGEEEAEQDWL